MPEGLQYHPGFISEEEENSLIKAIELLEFSEVRMHGIAAQRRTAHFGWVYGYESWRITPGPPVPEFLLPLREHPACVAGTVTRFSTTGVWSSY